MASLVLNTSVVRCEVMEKRTVGIEKRLECVLVFREVGRVRFGLFYF